VVEETRAFWERQDGIPGHPSRSFGWPLRRGYIRTNPFAGIGKTKEPQRPFPELTPERPETPMCGRLCWLPLCATGSWSARRRPSEPGEGNRVSAAGT
jgi:hypothetical protein